MRQVINFPNLLSFTRILLSFGVMKTVLELRFSAALVLLFVAGITDFLDGYIARKLGIVSQFGAALDPLADKILMFFTYISVAYINMIPMYVVITVIARDILILSAVIICFSRKIKIKMAPLISSKINTTIQIIYVLFVLACNYFRLHITLVEEIFAWVVVATTVWSGVGYVQKYQWIGRLIFKR